MIRRITSAPAILAIAGIALITSSTLGEPIDGTGQTNNNCAACHKSIRTDMMRVTPQSLTIDLGTQLDGTSRGALNAFQVEPGGTVNLSMDLMYGSGKWAAQLKQLAKGGQALDLANTLVWSQSGNTGWRSYGTADPYFTTSINSSTTAKTLTFALTIDAATPADTYDLVFAVAGKSGSLYYQEEHFYLQVVGATATGWAGYAPDLEGNIDTGSFLSWINVSKDHDWVWVYNLGKYVYLPEEFVDQSGAWVYVGK